MLIDHWHAASLCQKIIDHFDAQKAQHYAADDYQRGYVITKNRAGNEELTPLVSLSIAVITNEKKTLLPILIIFLKPWQK